MSAVTELKAATGVTVFPADLIEAQLRKEFLAAIETEAALGGFSLPPDAAGKASASVQIDSLVAVEILCTVEPIVDFELEDSVVRAGGYASVDDALKALLPRIEKEWQKRKGGKK